MDGTLLKHKKDIIEMVNAKINDIHKDVYTDGGETVLDGDELDDLLKCVKILNKLGKIRYMDHEIKMDMHEKGGNPYSNPTGAGNSANPHGHGYGTIQFTTMG